MRLSDKDQHRSTRPTLLPETQAPTSADENILASLEEQPGPGASYRPRGPWTGVRAALLCVIAVLLTTLVCLSYNKGRPAEAPRAEVARTPNPHQDMAATPSPQAAVIHDISAEHASDPKAVRIDAPFSAGAAIGPSAPGVIGSDAAPGTASVATPVASPVLAATIVQAPQDPAANRTMPSSAAQPSIGAATLTRTDAVSAAPSSAAPHRLGDTPAIAAAGHAAAGATAKPGAATSLATVHRVAARRRAAHSRHSVAASPARPTLDDDGVPAGIGNPRQDSKPVDSDVTLLTALVAHAGKRPAPASPRPSCASANKACPGERSGAQED